MASLTEGDTLTLRGPGIETAQALTVAGLPADFQASWRGEQRRLPLGVDLLLASGDRFCALTRPPPTLLPTHLARGELTCT